MSKRIWWLLLVVVIVAGAAYYFLYLQGLEPADEVVQPPPTSVPAIPEPEPATDDAPDAGMDEVPYIDGAEPERAPLPPLDQSDEAVLDSARELLGEAPVRTYVVAEGVIPKLVAAIDALTLEQVPKNIIPLQGPGSEFGATADQQSNRVDPATGLPVKEYILDPANYGRYTAQVELFEAVDTGQLLALYAGYYPLLMQSYRELGYPEGEFSDRLLEVIDHLLATPEPEQPLRLVKPEAYYLFADPELEALSAGQKLLIRMGPDNAARVNAKLSEIRSRIQTQRE